MFSKKVDHAIKLLQHTQELKVELNKFLAIVANDATSSTIVGQTKEEHTENLKKLEQCFSRIEVLLDTSFSLGAIK